MKSATKVYVLSDGVKVEASIRKSNRTGYTGAALSPSWTLDADRPFIAACGNPSDPNVMKQMSAQERTSWHGGAYSDAREAAYVVGRFKQDPVGTERLIQSSGAINKFPADLYDLPEGLEYEKAVEILKVAREKKKVRKEVKVTKDKSMPAAGNLYSFFSRDSIVDIVKSVGSPEKFQASISGLTIEQFANKFNLSI